MHQEKPPTALEVATGVLLRALIDTSAEPPSRIAAASAIVQSSAQAELTGAIRELIGVLSRATQALATAAVAFGEAKASRETT